MALLGLFTITGAVSAQPIPTPAKITLARLYPAATRVKWGKEARDYEASFSNKGQSMSLVVDPKGTVKETETVIAARALPAPVQAYVAKKMPGKPISEAAIIVDAAGTKRYEAEVNGKDYLFDAAGKPLKK